MPSLRDIRRRIRGIRNTAKITKAMELVAASRLRRAQMRVTAARPYAEALRALVAEQCHPRASSTTEEGGRKRSDRAQFVRGAFIGVAR